MKGFGEETHLRRTFAIAAVLLSLVFESSAVAQNDALSKLLVILRDRGSITQQEYEELREAAEGPARPESMTAAVPESAPQVALPPPIQQPPSDSAKEMRSMVETAAAAVVAEKLSGKWYERLGLRGYTQFRLSEVLSETGPPLEVFADRSVNRNEALVARRIRFILSGDVTNHLYLYAQPDFNASTGAADFSLQMRDLYADISFDKKKEFRVRLGQSKVPFGFVNLQSSQNRGPFERPDALNSTVEGERDFGAYFMWAPAESRKRFRDLVSEGLKGSGDYGVVAMGVYDGQGPNRSDQNGQPHTVARISYPFKTAGGKFFELGAQAHYGRFVTSTQSITNNGVTVTPVMDNANGVIDKRVAFSAILYPQPFGIETEWTFGTGPELSNDFKRIESRFLNGGYAQVNFRQRLNGSKVLFPFTRWNYYDGARKFARNAPAMRVNELDFGFEFTPFPEIEITTIYSHSFLRTRTGSFPYDITRGANRIAVQAQWNY